LTTALLAAPPGGIDTDILMPILSRPETRDLISGVMANLNPTGTGTMLASSGNLIGDILDWSGGAGPGLDPQVIVNAMAGPAGNPNQNVLRRTVMNVTTQITVFGFITLPPMSALLQVSGARLNASPGEINFNPGAPW
jgi:hypothetical protein